MVPATPHHPPGGFAPASTPTPTKPSRTPARREPRALSLFRTRKARSTTKIGIEAFAIAAVPESMCVWPQAISVKGSAALTMPGDEPDQPQAA